MFANSKVEQEQSYVNVQCFLNEWSCLLSLAKEVVED